MSLGPRIVVVVGMCGAGATPKVELAICVTPQTFFLNDFFSWNLIFRCFKVHHEFIIILGILFLN